MYKVLIYNNNIETLIHYPTSDEEAPHISDMNLKIVENQSNIFDFKMFIGHIGYDLITDLVTKVKIVDVRDNSIKFEGRVLLSAQLMDSSGVFYKDITCESELGYLNDSRVGRWELHPGALPDNAPPYAESNHTVQTALTKIINNHNSRVNSEKQFTLGNVEVNDAIYFATNYESSLDIIISKLINDNGLVIKIRKENGIRYLDVLLDNPATSNTKISLRINLKTFKKTPNYNNFCTSLIAIGADGLTFEDINNGKNYVEDSQAIATYGIITKAFEFKDITIKENLLVKATAKLAEILNDSYTAVEVSALDLSYIGLSPEEFEVGVKYLIENEVQNYSNTLKLVSMNLDLSEPWNSSLTFSNFPITAVTNAINTQQEVSSNRVEMLTYNGRIIQKVTSIDGQFSSYREQTDQAIIERLKTSDLSLEIEERAGSIQIAFNNIDSNIQNKLGKFSILNAAFELKNGNNVVVIDGSHNMHKIMIEGTTTLDYQGTNLTVSVYHGLGYKPVCACFQMGANGADEMTVLPALTETSSGIAGVIRSRVDSNYIYFDFTKFDGFTIPNCTIYVKYFLYKEVAF